MFADIGDTIRAEPTDSFSFRVEGEFASELAKGENLVLRAVDALFDQRPPLTLTLTKRLPVAAGLGGGTSDGAATLRLLRRLFPEQVTTERIEAAALTLGSDGPACLTATSVLMGGRGEQLQPAPPWPALPALLVNPSLPCPTAAVYRTFDDLRPTPLRVIDTPASSTIGAAVGWLQTETGNDLQPSAAEVQPASTTVLKALGGQSAVRLARLSGSGATAFGLCDSAADAEAAAASLTAIRPSWWVRTCTLNGPLGVHEPVILGNRVGLRT